MLHEVFQVTISYFLRFQTSLLFVYGDATENQSKNLMMVIGES